jgi:hypothetical protein
MRAYLQAGSCFVLTVLGGCQVVEYGPSGGAVLTTYGYHEKPTEDGQYILTIQAFGGVPEQMHAMWDRRAREICGPEFQKQLYRAERPTVLYDTYGGRAGDMVLEGYLRCGAAPAGAGSSGTAPEPASPAVQTAK